MHHHAHARGHEEEAEVAEQPVRGPREALRRLGAAAREQGEEEHPHPQHGAGHGQGEGAREHLARELAEEQRGEAADHVAGSGLGVIGRSVPRPAGAWLRGRHARAHRVMWPCATACVDRLHRRSKKMGHNQNHLAKIWIDKIMRCLRAISRRKAHQNHLAKIWIDKIMRCLRAILRRKALEKGQVALCLPGDTRPCA